MTVWHDINEHPPTPDNTSHIEFKHKILVSDGTWTDVAEVGWDWEGCWFLRAPLELRGPVIKWANLPHPGDGE